MRSRVFLGAVAALGLVIAGVAIKILLDRADRKSDLMFADVTINYADSTFSWTLMNLGSRSADPGSRVSGLEDNAVIEAILSNHDRAEPDTADRVVARHPLGDADRIGSLESLSGTLSLPASAGLCEFNYLKVRVDPKGVLEESDTGNNLMLVPIDCDSLPDLAVTNVDIDYGNGVYRWTVSNVGMLPADMDGDPYDPDDALGIHTFLSNTPRLNGSVHGAGIAAAGEPPLGILEPGHSRSGELPLPDDLCEYKYLLVYVAYYTPMESNLANNTAEIPLRCP